MPSTVISDFDYDPETETLSVWFRPNGRRYDYFDVPFATYDALRNAPSKGRHFNLYIRDSFFFVQVDDPEAVEHRTGPRHSVTNPAL